uniref:CX domain-containing protein n=1 Tax=Elaeophora elaphi TaxID=1147741 RepID=A0A0R3RLB1_9BILA
MYRTVVCLLLLTSGISNALKINMGRNRGSSAARVNLPHLNHPPGGGYRLQQGAYHPQQSAHYPQQSGHYPQQNNFHQPVASGYHPNRAGGYHQRSGFAPIQTKTSNKGTFGKAFVGGALGAAAGLATFELGKAILHSASEPLRTPNGQNYYFDERNHQPKSGYFMCSMPMEEVVKTLQESSTPAPTTGGSTNSTAMTPEQFFKTVQFQDGSRPKSLTWNCKSGTEVCCGTDCCPAQPLPEQQHVSRGGLAHHGKPLWVVFVSVLVLLIPLRH